MTADEEAAAMAGPAWGFIGPDGAFHPLPKRPLIQAGLGPPPFDVVLPSQAVRHVVMDLAADAVHLK